MVGGCGGELRIKNILPSHIENIISKAVEAGLEIDIESDSIYVNKKETLRV